MEYIFTLICILFQIVKTFSESFSTVVPIPMKSNVSFTKQALRYGFHRTHECPSFEISYLCIQKCLDLNYDVAHADKKCKCTCYVKKDKAKYSPKYNTTRTKWKLGAPTTAVPAWAQDNVKVENEDSDQINNLGDEATDSPSITLSSVASNDISISTDVVSQSNDSTVIVATPATVDDKTSSNIAIETGPVTSESDSPAKSTLMDATESAGNADVTSTGGGEISLTTN